MCSPQNEAIMNDVINDFVANRTQFTAFDATQAGKDKGTTERHGQLKRSVYARWDDGSLRSQGYDRDFIHIPGVSPNPWLYFPTGSDPQDYIDNLDIAEPDDDDDDDDYIAAPGSASTAVAVAPAPAPVNTTTVAIPKRTSTSVTRKRFSLNRCHVGWMELNLGDPIRIKHDSGQNRLIIGTNNNVSHFDGYVISDVHVAVTTEKRVRLNPRTLRLISNGDDFVASEDVYTCRAPVVIVNPR